MGIEPMIPEINALTSLLALEETDLQHKTHAENKGLIDQLIAGGHCYV